MKIKFTFGPYGYEVVLGNITEKIYNKYSQDNNLLNDAVSGFEENSDLKEWSDIDDISHVYGPSIENETIDQYLKISNDDGEIILNIPLTIEEMKNNFLNIIEDINHSGEKDLAENFYFFGQSGEKGEWENLDNLIEVNEFKASEFSVHGAKLEAKNLCYQL